MKRIWILSVVLLPLLLLLSPARGQTILGRHTADKVLAAFFAQNTNANQTVLGLNANATVTLNTSVIASNAASATDGQVLVKRGSKFVLELDPALAGNQILTNPVFAGTSPRFHLDFLPLFDSSFEGGWLQMRSDGTFQRTFDGDTLTNLNASELQSGTVPSGRLPGTLSAWAALATSAKENAGLALTNHETRAVTFHHIVTLNSTNSGNFWLTLGNSNLSFSAFGNDTIVWAAGVPIAIVGPAGIGLGTNLIVGGGGLYLTATNAGSLGTDADGKVIAVSGNQAVTNFLVFQSFSALTNAYPSNTNDFSLWHTFMRPVFPNGADHTTNGVLFYTHVPEDLDDNVNLRARVRFTLGGSDTGSQRYVLKHATSPGGTALTGLPTSDPINLDIDVTSGDINELQAAPTASGVVGWATLTGWTTTLNDAQGQHWFILLSRDGNDAADTSTVDSRFFELTIEYRKAN